MEQTMIDWEAKEREWVERLSELLCDHPEGLKQQARERIIAITLTAVRAAVDSPQMR
jgi:hypothetical protein